MLEATEYTADDDLDEPSGLKAMTDAELVGLVRGGSDSAMAELWTRWVRVAVRMAGRITDRVEPEDLAAEAFLRILRTIRKGAGPEVDFRGYLYVTLRYVSMNLHRESGRLEFYRGSLDEFVYLASPESALDDACADRLQVRAAFGSLPPHWRRVLWHTEVEGVPPRLVAPLMGISPNAVSALRLRAKAALVEAWSRSADGDTGSSAKARAA